MIQEHSSQDWLAAGVRRPSYPTHTLTDADLLKRLERCFDKGETETLVMAAPANGLAASPESAWVKVIYVPTGFEAVGDKHRSQIRNKAAALLDILRMLHESAKQ